MTRWIDDDHLWIRRAAIIAQLRHKADEEMLFDFCLRRAHETEFFIRKAIGWALREHSKTAPQRVKRFLAHHRDEWSSLTWREAGRHLDLPDARDGEVAASRTGRPRGRRQG